MDRQVSFSDLPVIRRESTGMTHSKSALFVCSCFVVFAMFCVFFHIVKLVYIFRVSHCDPDETRYITSSYFHITRPHTLNTRSHNLQLLFSEILRDK